MVRAVDKLEEMIETFDGSILPMPDLYAQVCEEVQKVYNILFPISERQREDPGPFEPEDKRIKPTETPKYP